MTDAPSSATARMPVALCTAANGAYFPLLKDMVQSVRLARTQVEHQLCVLDLGLEQEHRDWLEEKGVQVVEAKWDIDFPARAEQPGHFRAQTGRAFLPSYFPGYETYIWMDSDLWIQDGVVIDWLVKAASGGAMAVVEELHPAYNKVHDQKELTQKAWLIENIYGQEDAASYGLTPTLNSGVYALRFDAPHWTIWAMEMRLLLARFTTHFVDQLALERTIHAHKLPAVYMPARANWVVSQARPAFCPERGKFVDPLPPHDPLWVIHMTLATKDMAFPIAFLDGRSMVKNLRFSEVGPLVGLFPEND